MTKGPMVSTPAPRRKEPPTPLQATTGRVVMVTIIVLCLAAMIIAGTATSWVITAVFGE